MRGDGGRLCLSVSLLSHAITSIPTIVIGKQVHLGLVYGHVRLFVVNELLQHRVDDLLQVRLVQIEKQYRLFDELLHVR